MLTNKGLPGSRITVVDPSRDLPDPVVVPVWFVFNIYVLFFLRPFSVAVYFLPFSCPTWYCDLDLDKYFDDKEMFWHEAVDWTRNFTWPVSTWTLSCVVHPRTPSFFCWLADAKIVSFLVYISYQLQFFAYWLVIFSRVSTTNPHATLKNLELPVFVCSFYWSLLLVVLIYFNIRVNILNYHCIKESASSKVYLVKRPINNTKSRSQSPASFISVTQTLEFACMYSNTQIPARTCFTIGTTHVYRSQKIGLYVNLSMRPFSGLILSKSMPVEHLAVSSAWNVVSCSDSIL